MQDRCTKNFFIYRDPASGQWSMLPWDLESGGCLGDWLGGGCRAAARRLLRAGQQGCRMRLHGRPCPAVCKPPRPCQLAPAALPQAHPCPRCLPLPAPCLPPGFGTDRGLGGQPAPDYCILACEQWNSPLYCDHNHPQVGRVCGAGAGGSDSWPA